jgi:Helix-turn-helix domain
MDMFALTDGGHLLDVDLSAFCCQNEACTDYCIRGLGNLHIDEWYGKQKQYRLLRCRTCGARFSERKGTRLFGSQLSEDKVADLYKYLAEGKSVRETARLIGVNRNTVVRYNRLTGEPRQKNHES